MPVAKRTEISLEQLARDILTLALKEGLVSPAYMNWADDDPQSRSAGELVGVANLLNDWLIFRNDADDD